MMMASGGDLFGGQCAHVADQAMLRAGRARHDHLGVRALADPVAAAPRLDADALRPVDVGTIAGQAQAIDAVDADMDVDQSRPCELNPLTVEAAKQRGAGRSATAEAGALADAQATTSAAPIEGTTKGTGYFFIAPHSLRGINS